MPTYKALAQKIASSFTAILSCQKTGNEEWEREHTAKIQKIVDLHFPHRSGFDSGTQFDFERSKPEKLIFQTSYRHMNEQGSYDGWTEHEVIVTPSLVFGFTLRVTGRDQNNIKEYIEDEFYGVLSTTYLPLKEKDTMNYDAIWSERNNASEGYPIGHIGDDINDLAIMGLGELVQRSCGPDSVAVYSDGETVTIVGDAHGPWAVKVFSEQH